MKIDASEIEYEVECLEEHVSPHGNVMASGDDEFDRECEQAVLDDYYGGNDWAWCTVRVVARIPGLNYVEGEDYLGCCSYKSKQDFIENSCYYEDMCEVAKKELLQNLEELARSVLSFVESHQ